MNYELRPGIRLADRYCIEKVIGSGGFGITYRGRDEQSRTTVAIKELFLPDGMQRDGSIFSSIQLTGEKYRSTFEKIRDDFLKEAVIVGIFRQEPGIVHVTDHFQENGTAYLVMEYIEGRNLKQYLTEYGRYSDEELVQKMFPVLSVLKKVHAKEVIHRDISPENLMVQPDGTFCLIDFGAAGNYRRTIDSVQMVKDGYSPPEQWAGDGRQGPWTDVYALCATIYECITGIVPQSAIERLLYDELKKPSELGIKMDPGLEGILWKGLALDIEDRCQDMEELENAFQRILPQLEQRPLKKSRHRFWICLTAISISAISVAAFFVYQANSTFRGIETVDALLVPKETMTETDYMRAKQNVEDRLQILAGDEPYRIQEKENGALAITTPVSLFEAEDVREQYIGLISGEWKPYVTACQWDWQFSTIEPTDLKNCVLESGKIPNLGEEGTALIDLDGYEPYQYIRAELSEKKAAEIKECFKEDAILRFYFYRENPDELFEQNDGIYAFPGKDDRTLYLYHRNLQKENLAELLAYNLNDPTVEGAFQSYCEIPANWESTEGNLAVGTCQRNEDEIENPSVTVSYTQLYGTGEWKKGEWYQLVTDLKGRMDAWGCDYAIGTEKGNAHQLVIKMKASEANRFLTDTVMEPGSTVLVASKRKDFGTLSYSELQLTETEGGGAYQLEVQYPDYEAEELADLTNAMLQQGESELYLKVGKCYVAQCRFEEPITDGRLIFSELCNEENSQISEENKYIMDYITTFVQSAKMTLMQGDDHYYPAKTSWTDEKNALTVSQTLLQDPHLIDIWETEKEKIQDIAPECKVTVYNSSTYSSIMTELVLEDPDHLVDDAVKKMKQIMQEGGMEAGWLDSFYFRIKGSWMEPEEVIELYFDKEISFYFPGYRMETYYSCEDGKTWYEELIREMQKDSFFDKYFVETDETET